MEKSCKNFCIYSVIRHEFALLRENVGLDRFRVEVQRLGEISVSNRLCQIAQI